MKKRILNKAAALLLILVLLCCRGTPAAKGAALDAGAADTSMHSSEKNIPETGEKEPSKELSSEEIENNGGFFIRVGNKIYFRRYGHHTLESSALFGQFLETSHSGEDTEKVSAMLAYDMETGQVTEVFEDAGYGRLFAGDGGFYCKRAGDGYGNIAYWISYDGSKSVDLGQAVPVGISIPASNPDKQAAFLALQAQDPDHYGELFILREGRETARAVPGEDEFLEFCGMTGEYAVYLLSDTKNNTNRLYSLSGKSGEAVCLGEMPIGKNQFYGPYLETEQFLADEKGVYLVASYYQGTGHFLTFSLAVSAVPGTADSLKLLASRGLATEEAEDENVNKANEGDAEEENVNKASEGDAEDENVNKANEGDAGDGNESEASEGDAEDENESDASEGDGELSPPILFLTAPGEADIVPGPAGTAGLSETAYGDLVYYDSPYSALELIPDYIPHEEWDSPEKKFLQTAEVVGDAVYLIAARAERNEEADIGWRMAYQLKELEWLRVPIAAGFPNSGKKGEITPLTQESY